MFTVEVGTEVAVGPDQAFAWVSDIANLSKWQGGVFKSEVLTPPPIRVGTRFRETFRLMGFPMTAECQVIEMKAPKTFGFSAKGRQMSYESRFEFTPASGGTRISLRSGVTMHGLWKLLGPMVKAEGKRESEAEMQRLKAALEGDLARRSGIKLAAG